MASKVFKRLWSIVALEGLILLAVVVYLRREGLPDGLPLSIQWLPWAALGAGALVSWRFRRSRLLFGVIVLVLADRGLARWGWAATEPTTVFHAIALLLPVNLFGLTLLTERGAVTRAGLARFGVIGVQVGLVLLLAASKLEWLATPMRLSVLPEGWFGWTPVAQPALAVFLATAGFMGTRLVACPNATGRGFLWASVAAFLALNASGGAPPASVYLSTGSLILIVSVIEASYFMAYRDALTGLPARRALNEELLRLNGQYTIAMVDVDHFKKFNDEYGHEVGDQVLRMVAAELERVGGGGTPYRYGGEEFALLFPGKFAEEVVPHLERVRESIESATFTLRGGGRPKRRPENPKPRRNAKRKRVSVTVSIGAAGRSDRRSAPSEVASFADRALYRAKKTGRNRVKVAGGGP